MFLAAAPYFSSRFKGDSWIETNYQSAIMTASTITSLVIAYVLAKMQKSASYPYRIAVALLINAVVCFILMISTTVFLNVSPRSYFAFLLLMVISTSIATAFMQNGIFSFVASLNRPKYMQGLVNGQAIAGILPALANIVTVLLFPPPAVDSDYTPAERAAKGQTAAFVYFLTAVAVSIAGLFLLIPLVRRHGGTVNRVISPDISGAVDNTGSDADGDAFKTRKVVPMGVLFKKLFWPSSSIALIFVATMFFPVFTARVLSVASPETTSPLFRPYAFIPLAFFFWNLGDLLGRIIASSAGSFTNSTFVLFVLTALRVGQVPLYLLCNIDGLGAVISSDFFYLVVVQLFFGLTGGWIFSKVMTLAPESVDKSEREAAGSFLGLAIMVGLLIGSLLSFMASNV